MDVSILEIIRMMSDSEMILSAATLGGAIYGIYTIFKKRQSIFFRYDETKQVIQLGLLLTIIVASFSALIPGALYRLPGGLDLPTAIILALFIGLVFPPFVVYCINMSIIRLKDKGWARTLYSKLKYMAFRKTATSEDKNAQVVASYLAKDEDVISENFEAIGARLRFEKFLNQCVEAGLLTKPTKELIMSNLPEIPDIGAYQKKLEELRKEREMLERADAYALLKTIKELRVLVQYYKEKARKYEESLNWKNRLPREIIIGLMGAIARQIAFWLVGA